MIAPDDAALDAVAPALAVFLPDHRILPLPAWDSLPYDRARPSRAVTGTRVASLVWLADAHDQPAVVLTTPEALAQRVPPAARLSERAVQLAAGRELDADWLRATLQAFGYTFAERVDEPGDAAVRPGVVDIFPAGQAAPVRLELAAGSVAAIRAFDPLTQRSAGDAGPVAVALNPHDPDADELLRLEGARRVKDRIVLPIADASPAIRLRRVLQLLGQDDTNNP